MPEKESKDTTDMGWSALTGAMEAVKDASPHSLVLLNKTLVGVLTLIDHAKVIFLLISGGYYGLTIVK